MSNSERPTAVSGRTAVGPDALEQWPAEFDRAALSALHRMSTGYVVLTSDEALLRHFANCALELFTKATHASVQYGRAGATDEHTMVFDRHGVANYKPVARSIRKLVLDGGEAVAFLDNDEALNDSESLQGADVRAGMCAPLLTEEGITGFVQIDRRGLGAGSFSQRDLEVLAVMSRQLAVVLRNSALQRELEQTVHELQHARSEMEQLAFVDPLTELSNRRLFLDRLEHSVALARRARRAVCLLYLDLDDFKKVNDTLGHNAGDELLKVLAQRLRGCVRSQDTVARIGGDEFAIVLDDVSHIYNIHRVCEKLLESLRQPAQVGSREVTVSTSIGVAYAEGADMHPATMLKNADMALYKAKRHGRNCYQFFTEDLNQEVYERAFLEASLKSAQRDGELRVVYQPLMQLQGMEPVGVEALLRWRHPERGLMGPEDFVSFAEESGLIIPIGEWMLRTAATAVAGHEPIWVSVNLAARQVSTPDLIDSVKRALDETRLPANRLVLEMTESTMLEVQDVLPNLKRLRDLGVRIAVDDFGTGYSSLSYLRKFPVDILKLDRSFIDGIPDNHRDAEIAAAIIAMGLKLKMQVVAEGIETREQLRFLRDTGCDLGQGFLWGYPSELSAAIAPGAGRRYSRPTRGSDQPD